MGPKLFVSPSKLFNPHPTLKVLRDWSLITGMGGGCEVLPRQKEGRGAEQVLAMLKGGGAHKVLR